MLLEYRPDPVYTQSYLGTYMTTGPVTLCCLNAWMPRVEVMGLPFQKHHITVGPHSRKKHYVTHGQRNSPQVLKGEK